jgi:hypothetical protein
VAGWAGLAGLAGAELAGGAGVAVAGWLPSAADAMMPMAIGAATSRPVTRTQVRLCHGLRGGEVGPGAAGPVSHSALAGPVSACSVLSKPGVVVMVRGSFIQSVSRAIVSARWLGPRGPYGVSPFI